MGLIKDGTDGVHVWYEPGQKYNCECRVLTVKHREKCEMGLLHECTRFESVIKNKVLKNVITLKK